MLTFPWPNATLTDTTDLWSAALDEEPQGNVTWYVRGVPAGSQGAGLLLPSEGGRTLTEAGASLLPVDVRVLAVTDFFGS